MQTDRVIEGRISNMVIKNKTRNDCKIFDFACPFNSRIEKRKKDKMKGYNDLKKKMKKILDMPVKVIPVVVGALRMTPKKLKQRLSDIEIETTVVHFQKTII